MFIDPHGRVVTSASDLTAASACEFSWLRRLDERLGRIDPIERTQDAMLRRAAELGDVHEERVLDAYDDGTRTVARIDRPNLRDPDSLQAAVQATIDAFDGGADVVFQATFATDDDHGLPFVGFADFIVRQPDGRYRVQDTKLARSAKVTALLQLAAYAGRMGAIGVPVDDEVDLILGDGSISTHRLRDIEPMYALRRRHLTTLVTERLAASGPADWEDDRYSRCGSCDDCTAEIAAHRDMWQVYNLRGSQRAKLRSAGLRTIDDVAAWHTAADSGGVPRRTMEKLSGQARLQVASEGLEVPHFEVVDPALLATLPEPSPGDIFFDFEGDPLWSPDGVTWSIDYLFGLVDAEGEFRAFWAHDLAEERRALLDFLDYVEDRRRQFPDLHIYHYAAYERTHLSSIAQRHGVAEDRVDTLLRDRVLVDLYGIVGGALRLGTPSYSIKKVEALHMAGEQREGVTNAADSVDQYAQYVQLRDAGLEAEAETLLQEIADYNEYDCISTLRLRDWLLGLAVAEAGEAGKVTSDESDADTGGGPDAGPVASARTSPVPVPGENAGHEVGMEGGAGETRTDATLSPREEDARRRAELVEGVQALAGDPVDPLRTAEQRAWGLAGAAVGFHEQEEKSFWWEHFSRLSGPVDEWADHRGVFHVESVEVTRDWSRKSTKARVDSRDLALSGHWAEGSTPATGGAFLLYDFPGPRLMYGTESGMRDAVLATVDEATRSTVKLTEATTTKVPDTYPDVPRAVTPGLPPNTMQVQAAIDVWVRGAFESGALPQDPLGDLLCRGPSRLTGGGLAPVTDEDYVTAVTESALRLDGSYLAVQGPPGTGKTYVAANTIVRLVRDHGWRVGVVAQSHKVVDNVLEGVIRHGLDPVLVVKAQGRDRPVPRGVEWIVENSEAPDRMKSGGHGCVLGGTAWAFARFNEAKADLDLLIIDEAGQFSLAKTIAAGACAKNLMLFGDPQQLPQVSQGNHPEPVETSALGFLSGGHDVLPPEYGYFLARSRRMDAAVNAPVSELSYEGRLDAHDTTAPRRLDGVRPGLETVLVEHSGNVTGSPEEADRVVEIVRSHLGQMWHGGETARELDQDDVIVVTPYNVQVQTIRAALDAAELTEVRVGTVDRFQGQEAVISITSLAASSAREVPRGLGFLLMRNRLNVSLSRAMWKAYLVCSPGLLEHLPNTPQGLADLTAFARLVDAGLDHEETEQAGTVQAAT